VTYQTGKLSRHVKTSLASPQQVGNKSVVSL